MTRFKKIGMIAIVIVSVLFAIYVFGVIVFWGRFPLRTTVNGHSITMCSPDEVTVDLMLATGRTSMTLQSKDGSCEHVKFSELGVYCESDNAFVDTKLSSWMWFTSLWKPQDYVLSDGLFYNRDDVYDAIQNLDIVTGGKNKKPSDVRVIERDGEFVVVQANDGFYIDTERLLNVMCQHLDAGDLFIDLESEDCYVKSGEIKSDANVAAKLQDKQKLQSLKLEICMDNGVSELLPSSVLDLAVYETEDNTVRLRPSVISSYVSALADKYDTIGMDRKFETTSGDVITLSMTEIDTFLGYQLNQNALISSILNHLSDGNDESIHAPWLSVGQELLNFESDIGDTYIEISIDRQHMWYYKDGNLVVDTDVVTGLDRDGWRTPVGVFYVMSLNTNYTMYYSDGSSKCNYFIKVTGAGVGIHDALSRSSFGGTIYQTGGSHGCINTPYDAEVVIFDSLMDMSDFHIPVIIY